MFDVERAEVLLLCPFCGGTPKLNNCGHEDVMHQDDDWRVVCAECGGWASKWENRRTKQSAIAAWNARAAPAPVTDESRDAKEDAGKLLVVAALLDKRDADQGIYGQNEVQRDLRRIANRLVSATAELARLRAENAEYLKALTDIANVDGRYPSDEECLLAAVGTAKTILAGHKAATQGEMT